MLFISGQSVMPLMNERGNKQALQWPECPAHIRMRDQSRRADDHVCSDNRAGGKSCEESDDAHNPGIQHLAQGMQSRGGKPVKLLTCVVYDMKRPQE